MVEVKTGVAATKPAEEPEPALKVGLVTDVGKVDDKSFNQSAWEGVQQAAKDLGVEAKYIETTDPKDYAKNIAQFADEKLRRDRDRRLRPGRGDHRRGQAVSRMSSSSASIRTRSATPTLDLAGLVFPEDQAGFLAGALAGEMTKTGKIGAVLGTDVVPPVWRFGEGYRAGAKYVNPTSRSTSSITPTWASTRPSAIPSGARRRPSR